MKNLPEIQGLNAGDAAVLGLVICIGSTVLASWGATIIATKTAAALPRVPFNAWGMAYGTLCNLAFALMQGDAPSLDPRPEYYWALAYLSIFGTVVAFSLYIWLLSEIGVVRTAYMAVMIPLVALMISTLFEGYIWTTYAVAGVTFVLAGNLLMSLSKTRKTVKA